MNLRRRESARLAAFAAFQTRSLAITTDFSSPACVACDQHLPPDFGQVDRLVILVVLGHGIQIHTAQQGVSIGNAEELATDLGQIDMDRLTAWLQGLES